MGDVEREGSPPAKRRFVVPVLSQSNAIGSAQKKRGRLLFGRGIAATATSNERVSVSDAARHQTAAGQTSSAERVTAPQSAPSADRVAAPQAASSSHASRLATVTVGDTNKQEETCTLDSASDCDDDSDDVVVMSPPNQQPAVTSSAKVSLASDKSAASSGTAALPCTTGSEAQPVTPATGAAAAAVPSSSVAKESTGTSGTTTSAASSNAAAKGATAPAVVAAAPVAAASKAKSSYSILINPVQKLNPLVKLIRNVPHEFDESIIPDYVIGEKACALFLSIKYHLLHPEYIYDRLKRLGKRYELRVLLVHVDVKDSQACLQQLTSISILAECTLILAWSYGEAARYLETYKAYEKKPADLLKERVAGDYASKLHDCLTTLRFVNKANVATLSSSFGSLSNIIHASPQALALCPGFGENKANRLNKFFRQPFMSGAGRGRGRGWRGPASGRGGSPHGVSRGASRGGGGLSAPATRNAGGVGATHSANTSSANASDDDDFCGDQLPPELEAILDVADVFDEFGDDDEDSLWAE